jgi:hypothetical protein
MNQEGGANDTAIVPREPTQRMESQFFAAYDETKRFSDGYAAMLANLPEQPPAAQDKADAARWRKLTGCPRVRLLGYARGGPQGGEGPIRHIGFEFWTDYPDFPDQERVNAENVQTLLAFVDGTEPPK